MRFPAAALGLALLAAPTLAAAQATCLVGPHPGVPDADAETVAEIVCAQLRKRGEVVGEPVAEATPGSEAFRTSLRPLGRKLYVTVQRIDAAGVVVRESELLLQQIEEVPVAAPRLVESLVDQQPIEQTARVNNLVGEEVRPVRKKDGEALFGMGFVGLAVTGTDVVPGAGFTLRTAYETTDFSVFGDLRLAGGSPRDDTATYFSLGVGGRFFLTDRDWSPFFGVGMGWSALSVRTDRFDGSNTGLATWGEIGVEALRFYETRLSIDLRAEMPLYELDEDGGPTAYHVPIAFGVTYLW